MHQALPKIAKIFTVFCALFSGMAGQEEPRVSPVFEWLYGQEFPPHEDASNSGYTNYAEYLLGTNPLDPRSTRIFTINLTDTSVVLGVPYQKGLRYKVQFTKDFQGWTDLGGYRIADGDTPYVAVPIADRPTAFFRIKAFPPLDSNNDGLNDWENAILGTDPLLVDSDGDGISDLEEFLSGSDPNDPTSVPFEILQKAAQLVQVRNDVAPANIVGRTWSLPTTVRNLSAGAHLDGPLWSSPTTVRNLSAGAYLGGPLWSSPILVVNSSN